MVTKFDYQQNNRNEKLEIVNENGRKGKYVIRVKMEWFTE